MERPQYPVMSVFIRVKVRPGKCIELNKQPGCDVQLYQGDTGLVNLVGAVCVEKQSSGHE